MVVDNVDDASVFFGDRTRNGKTLQQCIPHSAKGTLLYTTRNRDVAVDLALPTEPIIVSTLTDIEGMQLLRGRLKSRYEEHCATELLKELDYIPLAVTQAAAFMMKRNYGVSKYLELYRKSDSSRTRLLGHEFSDHGRQLNSMESVAKTWTISFELIRKDNPRAADLLCLMSFFDRQAIPLDLLYDEECDELAFDDAVAVLQAFSLVEYDGGGTSFDMHRLVQLATRWWLTKEQTGEEEKWAFEALRLIASRFPQPQSVLPVAYPTVCASLLPHAELILQYNFKTTSKETDLARATLRLGVSRYILWMAIYPEGMKKAEESYQIWEKYLGEKDPDTLRSLGLLFWGVFISNTHGKVEMGWQLLLLRRGVLGEEHPETIDCLCD
jgi:hypothetical protein